MENGEYAQDVGSTGRKTVAELRDVSKRFGDVRAVSNLNLAIGEGEFPSFPGPSGCCKTTALRMLAGFERPTEGNVILDGEVVNSVESHHRPVNTIFQHYAMSTHDCGAKHRLRPTPTAPAPAPGRDCGQGSPDADRRAAGGFENRRIWEMSGGQQQRVALALPHRPAAAPRARGPRRAPAACCYCVS